MISKSINADTPVEASHDQQNNLGALENIEQDLADAPQIGQLTEGETGGKTNEHTYELVANEVTYLVKIASFEFNGDTQYYLNVNEGPSHLYLWDEKTDQLKPLDEQAAILPEPLLKVISDKLIASR